MYWDGQNWVLSEGEIIHQAQCIVYGEPITTVEVCRRAGVTYRMLDMWIRTGLVAPAFDSQGSGTVRRWWPYQVGEVCEIGAIKHEQKRLVDMLKRRRIK